MPRSKSPSPRGAYAAGSRRDSHSRSPPPRRGPSSAVRSVIRIGRLTKNVSSHHLDEIFSPYGRILDIELPVDRRLGTHRGTAWITYTTLSSADKAADYMDGGQIDGSVISVVLDEPPSPPPRRARSYSRSISPVPKKARGRSWSRSPSPRRYDSRSRSRSRSRTPRGRSRTPMSVSRSPSPNRKMDSRSPSPAPRKGRSKSRSRSMSRSRSGSPPPVSRSDDRSPLPESDAEDGSQARKVDEGDARVE